LIIHGQQSRARPVASLVYHAIRRIQRVLDARLHLQRQRVRHARGLGQIGRGSLGVLAVQLGIRFATGQRGVIGS